MELSTKQTKRLLEFVRHMNQGTELPALSPNQIAKLSYEATVAFNESYGIDCVTEQSPERNLRASSLGKPAVLQALKVLGYDKRLRDVGFSASDFDNRMKRIFLQGHLFEAQLFGWLEGYGFKVTKQQHEIDFCGIKGHIDGVINVDGDELLIEVKTMSSNYYGKTKGVYGNPISRMDDSRGYNTQLAIYTNALQLPGFWFVEDKGTSEIDIRLPNQELLSKALERAEFVVNTIQDIKSFHDIYKFFTPPEPVPFKCKRQLTGDYVLPDTMKYTPWRDVFYVLDKSKGCYPNAPQEFVRDIREPADAERQIEKMLEVA